VVVTGSEEDGVTLHTFPECQLLAPRQRFHSPSNHGILERYRQGVTTM
jgi:hypothetical protein